MGQKQSKSPHHNGIKEPKALRKFYKRIAAELRYGPEVRKLIDKAMTEDEISQIMTNARKGVYKKNE